MSSVEGGRILTQPTVFSRCKEKGLVSEGEDSCWFWLDSPGCWLVCWFSSSVTGSWKTGNKHHLYWSCYNFFFFSDMKVTLHTKDLLHFQSSETSCRTEAPRIDRWNYLLWILGNCTVITLCIPFAIYYDFFVERSKHSLCDWLYTYSLTFLST